jgi:hypothetical protein
MRQLVAYIRLFEAVFGYGGHYKVLFLLVVYEVFNICNQPVAGSNPIASSN